MKIFTRVLLGVLSIGLVFGSKAASFGVIPGVLPVHKGTEASKSDTVLLNWRTAASLTITDFGISTAMQLPSYNPNAKKYSPFLYLNKNSNLSTAKPGVRSQQVSFASTARVSAPHAAKEAKVIPTLTAYPNPSRGLTKISLSSLGDDNYKIRISNAIGKVYKEFPVSQGSASETIVIDLSPLPAGVYFYSLLVNEKMVETKRLILQQQ
ncbi:MAG: T9SS type A sorting domain-containing protein [Rufibacter sp.]